MSTRHTPGPWTFDKDAEEITCEKRRGMAAIATVETGWAEPFESEQQANAHLIAAAPEMLEALQAAKNSLVAFKFMPSPSNAWEDSDEANLQAVDAAIAKATNF